MRENETLSPKPTSPKWVEFLLVVCIALLITYILMLKTKKMTYRHPNFGSPWDHHRYIKMAADNPLDFHLAPFCWRIGVPMLVKVLPFDLQRNFLAICFFSIWMTGAAMYYLAKLFNFSTTFAFIGMFMFYSLGWATKLPFYDFWLVDNLAFLFITVIIYCIIAGQERLFVVLLTLGVFVKESVIFTAPLYYTFNARKIVDAKTAKRFLLFLLPAVMVLISLRLIIPQKNDDMNYRNSLPYELQSGSTGKGGYEYGYLFKRFGLQRIRNFSLDYLKGYTVGTFGVVVMLLPFFAIKRNSALLVKFIPFILLVYSQLLFAGNANRLLVIAFPAMIVLALNGACEIAKRLDVKPIYFAGLPLLMLGLNLFRRGSISAPVDFQALFFILYLALMFQGRGPSAGWSRNQTERYLNY